MKRHIVALLLIVVGTIISPASDAIDAIGMFLTVVGFAMIGYYHGISTERRDRIRHLARKKRK